MCLFHCSPLAIRLCAVQKSLMSCVLLHRGEPPSMYGGLLSCDDAVDVGCSQGYMHRGRRPLPLEMPGLVACLKRKKENRDRDREIATKRMGEYLIEALRNNFIGIIGDKATPLWKFGKYSWVLLYWDVCLSISIYICICVIYIDRYLYMPHVFQNMYKNKKGV